MNENNLDVDYEKLLEEIRKEHPDASSITMVRVEGTLTKADGTVIELGELGFWHKNPLMRWTPTRNALTSKPYHEFVQKYKIKKVLFKWLQPQFLPQSVKV